MNTLAAVLAEEPDAIEEIYEPFLMQIGFLEPHSARASGDAIGIRAFWDHAEPKAEFVVLRAICPRRSQILLRQAVPLIPLQTLSTVVFAKP